MKVDPCGACLFMDVRNRLHHATKCSACYEMDMWVSYGVLAVWDEEPMGVLHIARARCDFCKKPRVVIHTGWTGGGGRLTTYQCAQCGHYCRGYSGFKEMGPDAYLSLVVWEEEAA